VQLYQLPGQRYQHNTHVFNHCQQQTPQAFSTMRGTGGQVLSFELDQVKQLIKLVAHFRT